MAQNIAEFRIIGRIGKIDLKDNVARIDIASNYNRKANDGWDTDTHWNRVTAFARSIDRVKSAEVGDLVHVTGRVRQSSYEREGATIYGVDLLADSFSVLARKSEPAPDVEDAD